MVERVVLRAVLEILQDPKRAYVYTGCTENCVDENCWAEKGQPHTAKCKYNKAIQDLEALLKEK